MSTFSDLELDERILEALTSEGYQTPTPVQSETIPALMSGRDVMGIAQTGTGKRPPSPFPSFTTSPMSIQVLDGPFERSCSRPPANWPRKLLNDSAFMDAIFRCTQPSFSAESDNRHRSKLFDAAWIFWSPRPAVFWTFTIKAMLI